MPNTTAEYRLLEVAIYDLKTENNRLRKELDESIHLNQAVSMLASLPTANEMDTLVKDGERLDWIFKHCDVGYDKFYKTSFENRDEIDQAMEDAQ